MRCVSPTGGRTMAWASVPVIACNCEAMVGMSLGACSPSTTRKSNPAPAQSSAEIGLASAFHRPICACLAFIAALNGFAIEYMRTSGKMAVHGPPGAVVRMKRIALARLDGRMKEPASTVSPTSARRHVRRRAWSAECRRSRFRQHWPHQATDMYWVSRNSIKPTCAPSRPTPDCFMPPKGAAGSDTSPRLRPIIPYSRRSLSARPRFISRV